MGSVCCVAARDKATPQRTHIETLNRNIIYSPPWTVQWTNQTNVEDGIGNPSSLSSEDTQNFESQYLFREGIPAEVFQVGENEAHGINASLGGNPSFEARQNQGPTRSLMATTSLDQKHPVVVSSTAPSPDSKAPLMFHSCSFPAHPTPSRHVGHSPGYVLPRQASDCQAPPPKFKKERSISEGRDSSVLSVRSSDCQMGSRGGSSDGWSMRTFSELVAAQKERWSFDSENTSSGHWKTGRSSSQLLSSPSPDSRACGICSKRLSERPTFGSQKILATKEISIVAVLVCGHVYHADCLEYATPESNKFDPSCPVCTAGHRSPKISGKAPKIEQEPRYRKRISRIAVADADLDGSVLLSQTKEGLGTPKLVTSSSMKTSMRRPFLKRHFSIGGSKSGRSMLENESADTKRRWFFSRSRKE